MLKDGKINKTTKVPFCYEHKQYYFYKNGMKYHTKTLKVKCYFCDECNKICLTEKKIE